MQYKSDDIPLLSVVIPTRNRIPYAISAIQSILEIPDSRLELVVQDNSDSRELESYVRGNILDGRFRYRYTPPPFSMTANFNAAMELVTGEYICLIGDDDGVNPEIIEAASWAKSQDLDALSVKVTASYLWQGAHIPRGPFRKVAGGTLSVSRFRGTTAKADLEKELLSLMRDGGAYYMRFALPKLYHGLIHRRCLEAVQQKTGAYFGGLSPDIFASLSIACVATRVVTTDYPLTIPGACRGSGSTYGRTSASTTRLEDTFLWRERGDYRWCELVPRVFSAVTVWADSGVAALRAMDRVDLVLQLNLAKLAAHCVDANRGIVWPVLRCLFRGMRSMGENPVSGGIAFAWFLVRGRVAKSVRRLASRVVILCGAARFDTITGLPNIVGASHALTRYLKDRGVSFAGCVRSTSGDVNEAGLE